MELETYQLRSPFQVGLAHQPADSLIPRGGRDEKASVAHMARAAGVVGLDVEATEAAFAPVVWPHLVDVVSWAGASHQHDGAEAAEPVAAKAVERHWLRHGVGVALLNLPVHLLAQVAGEGERHLRRRCERDQRRRCHPVSQRDLSRHQVVRQSWCLCRAVRRRTRRAEQNGTGRVIEDCWHSLRLQARLLLPCCPLAIARRALKRRP